MDQKQRSTLRTAGGFAAVAVGFGAFGLMLTGPTLITNDQTCAKNGESLSCDFDMKWVKQSLVCAKSKDKTFLQHIICSGSTPVFCGDFSHKSGEKLTYDIIVDVIPESGKNAVKLTEKDGTTSKMELPECPQDKK